MKKQSYQERVQAIAEEMAKVACGKLGSWNDDNIRISIVESYLPFARIAIAEMAAAVRTYAIKCAAFPADDAYTVEQFLKQQGLIPHDGKSKRANEECKSTSEEDKAFIRGAACVIATIHRSHGEETSTREAFSACIGSWGALISCNPDPFDLEALQMFNPNKELR